MPGFLSAHGYDPGPTQRPALAGAAAGIAATIPAIAILALFGSLRVEADILKLSIGATLAAGWSSMALAGALYGALFRRAANDRSGGWLFGMAFGFLLWTAGAVMVLPLASGGLAPGGKAAIGLFLSLLTWGTTLGLLFPRVHRRLHVSIAESSKAPSAPIGPDAAAQGRIRD